MRQPTADASHWLRQHLDVPCPTPFQIGETLGQQDRQRGRPDAQLLADFGLDDQELAQAAEGWRKGYGLLDEIDRSGPVRVDVPALGA